jgi:hypothetical protein
MSRAVIALIAALTLICAGATACSDSIDERQQTPVPADEAAGFGEVMLPAGAKVLGTSTDGAIDTRYELALRVDTAQLAELLAKSRFTTPVTPSDYGRERNVVAGPPMSTATDLRYAQDRVDTADYGPVTREIFEDHRSPDEIYVHLFMFTT